MKNAVPEGAKLIAADPPKKVEPICGIDAETIRDTERMLASVKPVMV